MSILIWPTDDIYFSNGANIFIHEWCHKQQCINNYVIVDFRIQLLKKLYTTNWISLFKGHKIIIISDKNLLPLANYYFKHFNCVVAVIESKKALPSLMCFLNNGLLKPKPRVCFTDREYLIIKYFMKDHSIINQANMLDVNIKTIYAFRHLAAKKMKLNRLIEIFSLY
ncbi:hypothetical protein [Erwinia rhapontici]|uniref:hypothetical protein n=1 Tax=Erwinia rhapontici TaxID=55212 RepID=UPI003BA1800C